MEVAGGIGDRHCRDTGQVHVVDVDAACSRFQARALTIRTWLRAQEAGEVFAHHARLGFVIAPFHVGQNAFESMTTRDGIAAIIEEMEVNLFLATAAQQSFPMRGLQVSQRRVHLEAIVTGQRTQHLEIVKIAPVPTANGALCKTQRVVSDDAFLIEELLQAQAVTAGAGACRIVEREQAGLQFADAVAAQRTGEAGREQQVFRC
jgi:hypothetical protein